MNRPTAAPPPVASTSAHDLLTSMLKRSVGVVGLCLMVAAIIYAIERQHLGVSVVYSLCVGLPCWLIIDLGRVWLARRLQRVAPGRLRHPEWPGWGPMSVCITLGVAIAFPLGHHLGDWLTGHRLGDWLTRHGALHAERGNLPGVAAALLLSLAAALVATWFFYSRGRLASAEAEAQAALRLATEHQLRLLQSQLEPHMLFNTLANLRALIDLDAAAAQQMLDRLIAFLRATLSASRVELHPLTAEFARLADYVELMRIRMGPRLTPAFDLPADLGRVVVPPLLLQPLVENAILHGLEPSVDGGRLDVSAREDGTRLRLCVRDTGVGLAAARTGGTGFGLEQVRRRLQALYGPAAELTLQAAPDAAGGTLACITLPLQAHLDRPQTGPGAPLEADRPHR
ncbi:histidine kinase [Aquabacterium sp. A7-Y]|uniref:sensor histidine kinase n=1 Tax=Aquabacterium sp. A7-Y TaxID=1349605 RepID=UPI00223D5E01|nr:histidine kinase [Aquabacterium sp. A7-Y]MCW7539284.1 histidine kinase [Aquabacterium sp. A7-Y]